jgi:hypothetical protein
MNLFKNYRKRQIGYLIGFLFSLFAWIILFLVIACSPVLVTDNKGIVFDTKLDRVAVMYDAYKLKKGNYIPIGKAYNVYLFENGHWYETGDAYPKTYFPIILKPTSKE